MVKCVSVILFLVRAKHKQPNQFILNAAFGNIFQK